MPRAKSKLAPVKAAAAPRAAWLTHAALVLAIGLVIARATMMEFVREPLGLAGGGIGSAGPGTSIGIDLLLCVPAILVLIRRVVDSTFTLRASWALALAGALAGWTALSVAWADDKFAAAVGAANFVGATALFWAACQLVRSWMHVRLVAACAVGLLLVYIAAGLEKRYVDHVDSVRAWRDASSPFSREAIMKNRGWTESDFAFRQFEQKLLRGDVAPFTASPNTYAAVVVLLGIVAAGIGIQRLKDRDHPAWAGLVGCVLIGSAAVAVPTASRTAAVVAILAGGSLAFLGVARLRECLAQRARFAYWTVVVMFALGAAAVVGHGLYHGSMPEKSLTFRWYYWTGAARMVQQHPLLGIGWDNFGQHYTAVRPPQAPEEVKDPHNFIVRAFAELGIIGGILLLLWIARLWWELIQPATPAEAPPLPAPPGAKLAGLATLVAIAASAAVLSAALSISWSEVVADEAARSILLVEFFKRIVAMVLLVVGLMLAIRSARSEHLDGRPAPWALYAILVGLGAFLLHNLLDFSLFEPGPMGVFALLAGTALGARQPPSAASRRMGRGATVSVLVAALVVWALCAGGLWGAMLRAEAEAARGDRLLAQANESRNGDLALAAASAYERAARALPMNTDYLYRAARAMESAGDPQNRARALLNHAIANNPSAPRLRYALVQSELNRPAPDRRAVIEAFEAYLRLDPADVRARLEYAAALQERFNDAKAALAQYRKALEYDDLLPKGEPKRLPHARRADLEQKIHELVNAPTNYPPPTTSPG